MKICPICGGNSKEYAVKKKDNKSYSYYECKKCGTIYINPDILEEMDSGKPLIEYTEEYWRMELQEARKRCFGACIARMSEVIYYATIPVTNFLDIGGGTGTFLDAISMYLPDNKDHFYSVEKYPPKEEYCTKSGNFYTCSYSELNMQFQAGICIEVVEHLTPKMLVDIFHDVASVSSDGAIYLINTGMPEYVKKEDPDYLDPFIHGHIISYSLEAVRCLLEPLGFQVLPIRGKQWAFCIEYNAHKTKEDVTARLWEALPENLALLTDSKMGSVLQILGRESINSYLIY